MNERVRLGDIAALVMAGGEGQRMGGMKPMRTLAGRPLLDFALEAASRHGGPVAIGVRERGQLGELAGSEQIVDAAGIDGPLASLAAAFDWAARIAARYVLTLPCDAPLLPHDLATRLRHRLDDLVAAALPRSVGQLHPTCALWRADLGPALRGYAAAGRSSLIGFAESVGFAVEDWGAPTRDPFFNVNTPDDLRIAEVWLAQPHLE